MDVHLTAYVPRLAPERSPLFTTCRALCTASSKKWGSFRVEALQRLHKIGFIGAFDEEKSTVFKYQLSFPLEGLLHLKLAPKVRDFDNKALVDCYRKGRNPFSALLETFPVPLMRR